MNTKQACQIQLCWLLLVTLNSVTSDRYDLGDHMEDAFETDKKQEEPCRRNPKEKTIICRVENDKILPSLNICTCSHLVFLIEPLAQLSMDVSLLQRSSALKVLPSIILNENHILNRTFTPENLIAWMKDLQLEGIDIRIEEKVFQENSLKALLIEYLQKIEILLKSGSINRIFMLTLSGSSSSLVKDPIFKKAINYVDLLSIKPEYSFENSRDSGKNLTSFDGMCLNESSGFEGKRTVLPIILKESIENVMQKHLEGDTYPQVDCALSKNLAGIDIWSLDDDDSSNACGRNPFPLLQHISDEAKVEKAPFDSFTDLDIILSTGESQVKEVQVLYEANEEMKKFRCERIGFFRHPTDCSKFYHCSEYRPAANQPDMQYAVVVYQCPRGLVYDEIHDSCNWPSHTEPCYGSDELMPVAQKKFVCGTPGFHVDPVDCRWFYYCSDLGDGRLAAFEFLCPSHLLGFDEERLLCNWKWMIPVCATSNATDGGEDVTSTEIGGSEKPDIFIPNSVTSAMRDKEGKTVHQNVHRAAYLFPENDGNGTALLPTSIESDKPKNHRILVATPDDYKLTELPFIDVLQPYVHKTYSNPGRFDVDDIPHNNSKSIQNFHIVNKTSNEYSKGEATSVSRHLKPHFGNTTNAIIAQNIPEKKLGTAYWHRSMTNSRKQEGKERQSSLDLGRKEDKTSSDHRYGIGSVRKINLKDPSTLIRSIPLDEDLRLNVRSENYNTREDQIFDSHSYYDVSSQTQGRSINERVSTNVEFENKVERSKPKSPFASVKCSKSRERKNAKETDEYEESDLECVSEVSLVINLKPGKNFEKYVLKPEKISHSAYQESRQVSFSSNNPLKANIAEGNSKQLQDSFKSVRGEKGKEDESLLFKTLPTERESEDITELLPSAQYYKTEIGKSGENQRIAKLVSSFSENESIPFDTKILNKTKERFPDSFKKGNNEEGNLLSSDIKKSKNQLILKDHLMPLKFYPQGVLINVNLNYINEIPPQVLFEVDRMLKKYMSDGSIDVNLLMTKLNATSEKMSIVENNTAEEGTKIDKMLTMLEEMLNQSSTTTEKNVPDESTSPQTTTEETLYENVTESGNVYEEITVKTSMNNTRSLSPNSPIIDVNSVKNNNTQNGEYFGRRRLFRKPKFPSLREQLEIQKHRQSLNPSTESIAPQTVTHTIQNRFRYPSLGSRVNLNLSTESKSDFLSSEARKEGKDSSPEGNSQQDSTPLSPQTLDDLEFSSPVELKVPIRIEYPSIREQLNRQAENIPNREVSREVYEKEFSSTRSRHFGDRVPDLDFIPDVHPRNSDIPSRNFYRSDPENNANKIVRNSFSGASSANSGPDKIHSSFDCTSIEKFKSASKESNQDYNFNTHGLVSPVNFRPDSSKFQYTLPLQPVPHHVNPAKNNSPNRNTQTIGRSMDGQESHSRRTSNIPSTAKPVENFKFDYGPVSPREPTLSKNSENDAGLRRNRVFYDRNVAVYDETNFEREIHRNGSPPNARTEERIIIERTRESTIDNDRAGRPRSSSSGGRRRRKGRKLRILVKKVPNSQDDPVTNPPTVAERIPENLLTEIRSKVLKKLAVNGNGGIELQIKYQDHVWNVPFVNDRNTLDISPEICTRAGLFQHPKDCNMFYECFWDKWLKKFTLHVFSCPVKLVYDDSIRGCSRPTGESHCKIG